MASKLQGMISNIAEQRKLQTPTKAPVVSPTTTNDISTMTKPADFINTAKTPVPVATPTSVTQGATTPTPVAQTPVKAPIQTPTTGPKVIGEQNGVVQYEKPQVTLGVTGTNLNLPTAKGSLDNPQYSFDVKDPTNYMGTGMTVEQFKTLPLESQSAYTNASLAHEQQKQGIIKQTQYAGDLTAQEELMNKQNAIKVENDRLSMENQAVQDNASVAKAQQDLATLKQNIGFLGQGGRPVQSQAVVDSYDRMLATSNQQYKDMVQIANNMKTMRENGIQFDENNYNAQLDEIHNNLKRNVDSVIQQAINGFSSDQIAGMIDSPQSLQKLQDKYLSMIDQSVMGLTNNSIANLQTMQEVYKGKIATAQQEYKAYQEGMQQYQKTQAEEKATFQKNENTLNKDMSSALGYYVDGNGSPLLSSEGTTIAVKKDMPAPIFDRESGVMVTFEPDANGNPVGITKQIMQPSQSAQLEQQYKLMQMRKMEQEMNTPKAPETVKTKNGTFQYNKDTGNYDIPVGATGGATGDLRGLASQYPGQAWAKNNNPTGIKTAISSRTKQLMQDAGVTRSTGTKPPSNESGTYMTFATIEDGLLAHKVLLTQAASDDINARLQQWVGTSNGPNYAREIMSEAGLPDGSKFSQLSDDQLNKLLTVHIKRESPGLYKLMQQPATNTSVQGGYEPQTAEEEQLLASVSQSKGKKVLPAGTVSMLSDGRALPNLVSDLDKIVTDNESKFGPIAGRIAGWNEYDTSGQNIQSKLKLVSQIVGKFMEGGVLRKEDEVKYEKMLPTLKDSPEVAKSKIENVKNILEQKYKGYIQDYSNNYDVSGFPIKLFGGGTPTTPQISTPVSQQDNPSVVASPEVQSSFDKYFSN